MIEQLQNAAKTIASTSATDKEKVDALDIILSYVDDIDTAIDFCKIGGLFVILPCLSSSYPEIRIKSALLIAELAQNNPYCQKALFEADVLPLLMNLLCENETVVAGLPAVSCLVRNYEPCLKAFTKIGGLECLLGCLQQSDNEKLITRAAFFLHSLCVDFPYICDDLIKLKAIDIIVPLIQPQVEFNVCLETLLSVLCSLIDCTGVIETCRSQCGFKEILEEIIKVGGDKPECNEIVEYSQTLLKRIYSPIDEISDR